MPKPKPLYAIMDGTLLGRVKQELRLTAPLWHSELHALMWELVRRYELSLKDGGPA